LSFRRQASEQPPLAWVAWELARIDAKLVSRSSEVFAGYADPGRCGLEIEGGMPLAIG
jgi:hypothetical protein